MGNYFVFGVEKKLLNDKLKIIPLGGGAEIRNFSDIKNNYAIMFKPEITYFPFDNAEIKFGLSILEGKKTTTFGAVKNNDEVFLKVKYSF